MKLKKNDYFIIVDDGYEKEDKINGSVGIFIGKAEDFMYSYEGKLLMVKNNKSVYKEGYSYFFDMKEIRKITKEEAFLELL